MMDKRTLIISCIFVLGLVLFTASSYEAMPGIWHTILTTGGYLCIFVSFIGVLKARYVKRNKIMKTPLFDQTPIWFMPVKKRRVFMGTLLGIMLVETPFVFAKLPDITYILPNIIFTLFLLVMTIAMWKKREGE